MLECNLKDFFSHEKQSSLNDNGQLHTTQKSDLTEILRPEADITVIDGSALINTTPPQMSKTFDAYAQGDVNPKLESYGAKYQRIDVAFDVYTKDRLKSETRSKRGSSIRRRVLATCKTPANWKGFLRDDRNKSECSNFFRTTYAMRRQWQILW